MVAITVAPADLTPRQVTLPEITLSVIDAGTGPPVLLLHGFPDRASMWEAQIRALVVAGYRVVAPDLRGFGDSDKPEEVEDYRMRRLVGDVLALLDTLDLDRVALAGHDWGSSLGWALTLASERITRYAAFSVGHPAAFAAAGLPQKEKSWYMLWFQFPGVAEATLPADDWAFWRTWAHPGVPTDDPLVARQIEDLSRPGALAAGLAWYRANIDPATFAATTPPALPSIDRPVLGVWGSEDIALSEPQMAESGRWVSGGFRYERVEGVGHWVPARAPHRTTALLREFLGAP